MSLHAAVGDALEEVAELVQAAGALERFGELHPIGDGLLERNGRGRVHGLPPPRPIGVALTAPAESTRTMNTFGIVPAGAAKACSMIPGCAVEALILSAKPCRHHRAKLRR